MLPVIFIELEEPAEKVYLENASLYLTGEKSRLFIRLRVILITDFSIISATLPHQAISIYRKDPTDLMTIRNPKPKETRALLETLKYSSYL